MCVIVPAFNNDDVSPTLERVVMNRLTDKIHVTLSPEAL